MADTSLSAVVRHLRQIASPSTDPRDDHELLDAFAARHDQDAFAVLVRRHGPMVLNVCRHVLRHEQDAEDAFQAAFLVLATKAASVSIRTSVAGFLHGVTYRLALKARREAVRRRRREACVQTATVPDAAVELSWREVQAVLEEEVQHLPEKYRLPFVLCHLEGLSRAEAGRQLGLKEGTVWSRLSQARARLQQRLTRRGIALSAALGAMAVAETPVRAELFTVVVRAARQSAAGSAAGAVSARVALLTQVGLQTITGKMKLALLGLVTLLAAGVGGMGYQALTAKAPETPAATIPQAKAAPEPKQAEAPRVRRDRHGDPLPEGAMARLGTVRWRHGYAVARLAYSPNGKRIAASGFGQAVTLWDVSSGKLIHKFPNESQPSNAIAFSPDGTMLATGDWQACHLWDVATGKELRQLKGNRTHMHSVAFAPDGKTVAGGDGGGTLHLWETATGARLRRIECKQDVLYVVAFSPDGRRLASGGNDGSICIWNSQTGKELHRLKAHRLWVTHILFSANGKRMLSSGSGRDETIREWDTATGRPLRVFGEKRWGRFPMALSADGTLLASGEFEGQIRLWDTNTGLEIRHWSAGPMPLWTVAFSPDGKTLASGAAMDASIHFWDVATGRERHPSQEHVGPVPLLRYSLDGKTLVSASTDRRMLWWDLKEQLPRRQIAWQEKWEDHVLALSPDGKMLADCSLLTPPTEPGQPIQLWDARTGKPGLKLGNSGKWLSAIAFSPDGRLLATGGKDEGVTLWDVRDGKEVRQLKGMSRSVRSLCFSPDGKTLAVGLWGDLWNKHETNRSTLRVWDVASCKEIRSFNVHDTFTGLAFSPDGKVLAGGNGYQDDAFIRLWNVGTGAELCRHTGHRESCGAIAFSPDGKLVASGTGSGVWSDNSVHVWEAATGRLIRRFEGHHSDVGSVAFAPDGLSVASGAGDSTILLWEITGRRPDGRWHVKPLTPRQLEACWTALADADAAKAYDAVWALAASPEQAVPFLQKHLPPVPRPDAKAVARLIADLDSNDFTMRQKATEELGKFSDTITPALRRTLENKPSLEMRRRIQQLLDQTRDWTAERLRDHRAMQALEHIGTRPARDVLEKLAAGAPESFRTEQAKAALRRMARSSMPAKNP